VKKFWGYIKAWFRGKSEKVKDPEVELDQAIYEAQKRDQELRRQAAQVIANRTQVQMQLERESVKVAESRELAKQALLKADAAGKSGKPDEVTKWNQAAQTVAMQMQASDSSVQTLTQQLQISTQQAEAAKKAVQTNAANLQEMTARRMQLMTQLQAAKMQEKVNAAMAAMTQTVDDDAPTFDEIEKKIQARAALAGANAELTAATPEGAVAELKASNMHMKADAALDSLRAELGLGTAGELPAATSTPAATPTPAPEPAAETPPAS